MWISKLWDRKFFWKPFISFFLDKVFKRLRFWFFNSSIYTSLLTCFLFFLKFSLKYQSFFPHSIHLFVVLLVQTMFMTICIWFLHCFHVMLINLGWCLNDFLDVALLTWECDVIVVLVTLRLGNRFLRIVW